LEFNSFLAGTGYPTGKNTRAGTGMGKILYPRVYMGNPTGRIFFDGYGYGMVLPDGYVPVAIPKGRPIPPLWLHCYPGWSLNEHVLTERYSGKQPKSPKVP
jgi:hypothetical protein